MAGYIGSTQQRFWTFSPADLGGFLSPQVPLLYFLSRCGFRCSVTDARRREVYASVRIASVEDGALPGVSSMVPAAGVKRKRDARDDALDLQVGTLSSIEPLSAEEEAGLLTAYEHRILELCDKLEFHLGVASTAVIFFKRFFVKRSPRNFPPVDIMHTAVFLAIKTESCPYTEVPSLSRKLTAELGLSDSDLVGSEASVLSGLSFQLAVHHPYLPLKALLRQCVKGYMSLSAVAAPAGHPAPLASDDPAFCRQWDVLQVL
jgi:hypothetical protein